jgi:hypothetical protein
VCRDRGACVSLSLSLSLRVRLWFALLALWSVQRVCVVCCVHSFGALLLHHTAFGESSSGAPPLVSFGRGAFAPVCLCACVGLSLSLCLSSV